MQGVGKKLYTPLDFTAYLDMRPYLSSSVMHARLASQGLLGRQQGRGALPAAPAQPAQQEADPCMYELYTVVCHRGNLQVRTCDCWYDASENFLLPDAAYNSKQCSPAEIRHHNRATHPRPALLSCRPWSISY